MAKISFPERRKNLAQQYAEMPLWILHHSDQDAQTLNKTKDKPKNQNKEKQT